MPLSGPGTATKPAGTTAVPNSTIESSKFNLVIDDIYAIFNTPRPIAYGGTNGSSAVEGIDNLSTKGTDIPSATTTDIGSSTGRFIHITGTTTITGLGTKTAGVVRFVVFDGSLTLTHNATSLILPGGSSIQTAAGDAAIFISEGSGNWRCVDYQKANGGSVASSVSPGSLFGLAISNNATDAANDIDIAAGLAAADASPYSAMSLASALTKRLDGSWVVGTNQGGLDTGSKANSTWYYLWLIQRSDTGVVDACFSTSATSPTFGGNIPVAYDRKRRIGAVRTDGAGSLLAFKQYNNDFWWSAPPTDVNVSTITTTASLHTLTIPAIQVDVLINARLTQTSVAAALYLSGPDQTDTAASGAGPFSLQCDNLAGGSNATGQFKIPTSTQQIRARSTNTTTSLVVSTLGWTDMRGRN